MASSSFLPPRTPHPSFPSHAHSSRTTTTNPPPRTYSIPSSSVQRSHPMIDKAQPRTAEQSWDQARFERERFGRFKAMGLRPDRTKESQGGGGLRREGKGKERATETQEESGTTGNLHALSSRTTQPKPPPRLTTTPSSSPPSRQSPPVDHFAQLVFLPPPTRIPFPTGSGMVWSETYFRIGIVGPDPRWGPALKVSKGVGVDEGSRKALGRERSFSLLHSPIRPIPPPPLPPPSSTSSSSPTSPLSLSLSLSLSRTASRSRSSTPLNSDEEVSLSLLPRPSSQTTSKRDRSGQFSTGLTIITKEGKKGRKRRRGSGVFVAVDEVLREEEGMKGKGKKKMRPSLKGLEFVGAGRRNLPASSTSTLSSSSSFPINSNAVGGSALVAGTQESSTGEPPSKKKKSRSSTRATRFPTPSYNLAHPPRPPPLFPLLIPTPQPPRPKKLKPAKPSAELQQESYENHWRSLRVEPKPKLDLSWDVIWEIGEGYACGDLRKEDEVERSVEISLIADEVSSSSACVPGSIRSLPDDRRAILLSQRISNSTLLHGEAPTGFAWLTREESIIPSRRLFGKVLGFTEKKLEEGGYGRMWEVEDWVQSERWVNKGKRKARGGLL